MSPYYLPNSVTTHFYLYHLRIPSPQSCEVCTIMFSILQMENRQSSSPKVMKIVRGGAWIWTQPVCHQSLGSQPWQHKASQEPDGPRAHRKNHLESFRINHVTSESQHNFWQQSNARQLHVFWILVLLNERYHTFINNDYLFL